MSNEKKCDCTHTQACAVCAEGKEIDWQKVEPPAPAAMSAEKVLKETALYIAEATQHKHRALSSSGVEDYFRHYGDLRVKEAVRAFAKELLDYRRSEGYGYVPKYALNGKAVESFISKHLKG